MTFFHGFLLWCIWLFAIVLNNQKEIISCACGLKLIGNNLSFNLGNNSAAIVGVNEDVAHVSSTSFSPENSLLPHLHFFEGLSVKGSTGNLFKSANITSPHFLQ